MTRKLFYIITCSLFIFLTFCKKDNNSEETNEVIDNNSEVGSAASALLADYQYKSLNVELIYMQGHPPTQTTIENLESFLAEHINKPEGINIIMQEIPASGQQTYSISELSSIENQYRNEFSEDDKLAASVIIVDGKYEDNNQVLGVAYKNTSMALFDATIDENSGGISEPSPSKLESTVMNHEFGHIMGLVNIGTDMVNNHEDNSHSGHCNNEDCLMYYASETTEIASFLISSPIPELDENCKQDIIANGGK